MIPETYFVKTWIPFFNATVDSQQSCEIANYGTCSDYFFRASSSTLASRLWMLVISLYLFEYVPLRSSEFLHIFSFLNCHLYKYRDHHITLATWKLSRSLNSTCQRYNLARQRIRYERALDITLAILSI